MLFSSSIGLAAESTTGTQGRIVTLGGTVTEIVFALGRGSEIVGVDQGSTYPEATAKLTKLNYHRQISAEGVLSLNPTEVILTTDSGPPEAIARLKDSRVKLVMVDGSPTIEAARARIRQLSTELDRKTDGDELVARLDRDLDELRKLLEPIKSKPGVLFLYARGAGTLMVFGRGTGGHAMIELAGGRNVIDVFEGHRPYSAEKMAEAAPEIILMMEHGLQSLGGVEGVRALPGVNLTPAGSEENRIVAMDDLYLVGFGPRLGRAAIELARKIHPELREAAENDSGND